MKPNILKQSKYVNTSIICVAALALIFATIYLFTENLLIRVLTFTTLITFLVLTLIKRLYFDDAVVRIVFTPEYIKKLSDDVIIKNLNKHTDDVQQMLVDELKSRLK